MITFGMFLRTRLAGAKAKILRTHHQVEIDLTHVNNPSGINIYLLVSKERYPQYADNPTEEELYSSSCDDMHFHAYMVPQDSKRRGLVRETDC